MKTKLLLRIQTDCINTAVVCSFATPQLSKISSISKAIHDITSTRQYPITRQRIWGFEASPGVQSIAGGSRQVSGVPREDESSPSLLQD